MPCVLAIDQSTSATKVLLLDERARCLDHESREHRQYYPRPGWVEHDAGEIWRNVRAGLRTVAARNERRMAEAICLSISNQRETVVVWERATGRPLHPAIVWQCRRGDALCAEQKAAGREAAIRARTGLRVDAYFSASKLQWLVRNLPGLRAKLIAGEALAGTVDSYLIHRLTGGAVFATDFTNASRTLLFDIGRLGWDDELCAWWEIPRAALPEVRESTDLFGETTLEGAWRRALPIRGVMGDSQASLFGQGCFEPGDAKVTLGTGSSVMLQAGSRPIYSERGAVTALAWVLAGAPAYALEGITISSASAVSWLRDRLGLFADLAEAEALAEEPSDSDGVYLVPAFSGLGFPYWQSEARGAIVGLSGHSGREHVVRASFESIAYQVFDALEAMREGSGLPLLSLRADGGPTANRFLMQFIADIAGVELRVAAAPDGSARGAACAGMLGAGLHRSLKALAEIPRDDKVYLPSMDPERAHRLLAGWRRAVRSVLPAESTPPANGTS